MPGLCAIRSAFDILRDRAQNVPAAKLVAQELAYQFPSNDGLPGTAINWLLDTAKTDAELQAEVAKVLETGRKYPWMATFQPRWPHGLKAD